MNDWMNYLKLRFKFLVISVTSVTKIPIPVKCLLICKLNKGISQFIYVYSNNLVKRNHSFSNNLKLSRIYFICNQAEDKKDNKSEFQLIFLWFQVSNSRRRPNISTKINNAQGWIWRCEIRILYPRLRLAKC